MDFGALLHTAQKNEKVGKKEGIKYYSTKFEPPKKQQRNKQQLSDNIKKFLAKKEAEEREKKLEAHRKKEELLALRAKDKKATRRVNVMLKRTKSANQSVLQDAVDSNNTSVTLAGPIQPDEDDYGYVSQEAAAFYNKMMEKYSKIPDEPKFSLSKKKVSTDLNSTRERVKAAIEREKEEANMPHKRKRKHKEDCVEEVEMPRHEEAPRHKPKSAAPPVLNFNDLLKLAEKKQFEPIVIEQKPKEEERLLTKKQKKEMEREKEWRDRRDGKLPPLETVNRIPKLNGDKNQKVNGEVKKPNVSDPGKKIVNDNKNEVMKKPQNKVIADVGRKIIPGNKAPVGEKRPIVPSPSIKPSGSSSKINTLNKPKDLNDLKKREMAKLSKEVPKKIIPSDIKPRQFSPSDLKPKQFPPKDLKPKQLPPSDVRRREFPPKDVKRKPVINNKRRIMDDDEDYDSEMDDFIDDGPEESEDYSKYISEIFGYDKSRYRNVDDDIDNMESTFAQQMREEVISTKIGIMEDLEDMRQEEEEKRQKALLKKKRKL
ncbi:protein SPT2 homolog [Zophobas morio]|uniref:protein SPT2 homolog n=1 Tax=Zophobas morio TaxID=2755281 RepID=UPI003082CB02